MNYALAFTFLTSAAVCVETEKRRREAQLLSQSLLGHKFSYLVVSLEIRNRIAARGAPNRVLVDKLHTLHGIDSARELQELAGAIGRLIEVALQSRVEDAAHKCTLARTGYARHDGHHVERKLDRDAF